MWSLEKKRIPREYDEYRSISNDSTSSSDPASEANTPWLQDDNRAQIVPRSSFCNKEVCVKKNAKHQQI